MSKTALLKVLAVEVALHERGMRQGRIEHAFGFSEVYHRGARNASITAFVVAAQDGSRSYSWIGTKAVEEAVEATSDERLDEISAQWSDDVGYAKVLRSALDKAIKDYFAEVMAKAEAERLEREAERRAALAAAVEADPFFGIA